MNDVQPRVLFQLDANLKALLYFNPQGEQCVAGIIKYNIPEAPFRLKQIVLSERFLDATPPV